MRARWAQLLRAHQTEQTEAAEAMQRALSRDVLNALIYRAAGTVEYAARRLNLDPPLRKALRMNPRMSRAAR